MMAKLLTLLSTACSALAGLLHLRRKAQAKARQDAITKAVHAGDVDEVARIHHTLLKVLLLGLLPVCLPGCAEPSPPTVIYINQPMMPVRLIHEGQPGWWLSDALYEATLLRLDELKERNEP